MFYQEHGYFTARVTDAMVTMRKTGGKGMHIPLIHPNKPGTSADITVDLEEGKLYHLNNITFSGVKFFRTPEALMTPSVQMAKGDVFSTAKLRKGLENMRKLYGDFGFIDFVAEPSFEPMTDSGLIDMSLSVDEGKQFFVRRIDFSGNTTTRDKIIRRELMIDEGQIFNNRLWELSILRLNQLGYFEPLKAEDAADIKRDTKTNTVDITLKVKERGKNSIQLNGGVSGIAGSFIGASYSTNNFLGLGETLSLSSQLGTRMTSVQFRFHRALLPGQADPDRFHALCAALRLQPGAGSVDPLRHQPDFVLQFAGHAEPAELHPEWLRRLRSLRSYQLKRSFARVGLTYGYNISNIKTLTTAATNYFTYIDFQGVGGPNQLSGIRTSTITPVVHLQQRQQSDDSRRREERCSSRWHSRAACWAGTSTPSSRPSMRSITMPGLQKDHVVAMHLSARFLSGYGGKVAPPFSRYFMGGENDVRGFDIWTISPIVYLPSDVATVQVYNNDGTPRTQKGVPTDHDGPFLPGHLPGRRYECGGQFRIPDSDRGAGDAGAFSPTSASTSCCFPDSCG